MVEYVIAEDCRESIIESILGGATELKITVNVEESTHFFDEITKRLTFEKSTYEKVIALTEIKSPRGLKSRGKIDRVRFKASADGGNIAEYTIGGIFRKTKKEKPLSPKQQRELEARKKEAHNREYLNKTNPLRGGLPK